MSRDILGTCIVLIKRETSKKVCVFDEIIHSGQSSTKVYVEEDEQNIIGCKWVFHKQVV